MSALYTTDLLRTATYVIGKDAFLLAETRPLSSFFRVHWRMLNIDGFHYSLRFESVYYRWSMEVV